MKQSFRKNTFGVLAVITVFGLAGCQADGPVERSSNGGGFASNSADCGAVDLQYLIGVSLTDFEEKGIAASHKGPMRIVRPNDAVTLDYRPERLNVKVNSKDRITGFQCN